MSVVCDRLQLYQTDYNERQRKAEHSSATTNFLFYLQRSTATTSMSCEAADKYTNLSVTILKTSFYLKRKPKHWRIVGLEMAEKVEKKSLCIHTQHN